MRLGPWTLGLLVGVVYVTAPYALVDDAYISFRYVMNLVADGELVFNLGERVEGATNLGWVIVLAGLQALLAQDLPQTALAVSLALNAFGMVRTWQVIALSGAAPFIRATAVLALGLNYHFVLATTNGLEAALFAATLAQIAWSVVRRDANTASIAVVVLFMTRPDGLIAGLALLVALWSEERRVRSLLATSSIIGIGACMVTLFRVTYFGEWIPNSIVAKSYGLAMLPKVLLFATAYLAKFALANGYLLIPPCMLIWKLLRSRSLPDLRPIEVFTGTTLGLAVLVTIRNGGDWMPHWRLLLQYGPLWAILVAYSMLRLEWRSSKAAWLLAWPLVAGAMVLIDEAPGIGRFDRSSAIGAFWRESTDRLRPILAPDDVVSAEALGYVGYHLRKTRFHDPVGLADPYIARHGHPSVRYGKHDTAYTLGVVKPAVALWHYHGHLGSASREVLDCYEIRARGGDRDALIMIRRDAAPRLSVGFGDWPVLESERLSTWSDPRAVGACTSSGTTRL